MESSPRAAVVGAGPVGCLAALGLARRGYIVDIFEARPDPRIQRDREAALAASSGEPSSSRHRSINLAISTRGLSGLAAVPGNDGRDLSALVLRDAVPMRARMIHTPGRWSSTALGKQKEGVEQLSQAYGAPGEHINSVSRTFLNDLLLDEAEAHPSISIRFGQKLRSVDFEAGADASQLIFNDGQEHLAHIVVGADGLHSKVREQLARVVKLDFSQTYIDSSYVELSMPPAKDGSFRIDPNHLHIWPRHNFMLIALANPDRSFTCTLFAPDSIFEQHLRDPSSARAFFEEHFSDALVEMGADDVVRDLMERRPSPLSTIRCRPYHYKGRAIILGDAAHAMVPFYGQGLNCGLEDVRVFLELLDKHAAGDYDDGNAVSSGQSSPRPQGHEAQLHPRADSGVLVSSAEGSPNPGKLVLPSDALLSRARSNRYLSAQPAALAEYSSSREADLHAIADLAQQNYYEMSSRVVSRAYLLRKQLDGVLMKVLPRSMWSSLYSMVTFSNEGYAKAVRREKKQKEILTGIMAGGAALVSVGAVFGVSRLASQLRR